MRICELKAAMARKSISIPMLASAIGINKKTLYTRFSGATAFTQPEISAIARILGLSDNDILRIFFADKVS